MKHFAATVRRRQCGPRFAVCVHSPRLASDPEGFSVFCPENGSKLHVPAGTLAPATACPAGAVVVRDRRPWVFLSVLWPRRR